ncbi:hypothetical protein SODALDRAFT_156605 [Sodiomyces alkalinus F11]|uniref:Uncharacterized protein n=1 Tax=Sodiomyces alkalinus (strain CBS 110278 / VKM F-3762 / F11) TaxID=1314773 RepID=A0A3N2PY07_SODAK|nr:hypothetical protein SODALDRAFT_156605 [Sodiomyces alkalinus F11]ROT39296.1 hypothetical protein SODALDRAFT_156605 [Sodiomyces alkalinus F11]
MSLAHLWPDISMNSRGTDCGPSQDLESLVQIGWVNSDYVVDPLTEAYSKDDTPIGRLDAEALRIPAPRRSENFMAPVNDTTNRRCQEWTMDFIRHLAGRNYINHDAIAIAQAERDPPTHGVGLRPVR